MNEVWLVTHYDISSNRDLPVGIFATNQGAIDYCVRQATPISEREGVMTIVSGNDITVRWRPDKHPWDVVEHWGVELWEVHP